MALEKPLGAFLILPELSPSFSHYPQLRMQVCRKLMPGKLVLAVGKGKIFEETDKDDKVIMGG